MMQMKNSIIHIFRNSGKKHLFITGSKKSGKTTMFKQLYPELLNSKCGITSYLYKDTCVILEEDATNEKTMIGKRIDGWMHCVKEGFLTLGVDAIDRMMENTSDWASIDEIGFLETEVELYQDKIRELLDKKSVLCCIRKQELPFLDELKKREDVFLWDMDLCQIGCVLMASGVSKRFCGNKLLMKYKDKTFIEHALCASATIPFTKRNIYTRTKELEEIAKSYNVGVKMHTLEYRNEAIALAMSDMCDMDACIFIPCDQPLLSSRSVEKVIEAAFKTNKGIVRLTFENEVGTPVLFKKKYFAMLANLPLKKGGSYIAKQYEEDVEYVKIENKYELFDIDTYEEYCELLKIKPEI